MQRRAWVVTVVTVAVLASAAVWVPGRPGANVLDPPLPPGTRARVLLTTPSSGPRIIPGWVPVWWLTGGVDTGQTITTQEGTRHRVLQQWSPWWGWFVAQLCLPAILGGGLLAVLLRRKRRAAD